MRVQSGESAKIQSSPKGLWTISDRALYIIYALALAVSISTWFIAVRAPLWLDETGSYWVICKGFSEILPRQGSLAFPAYYYILWLSTKIIGASEIALRVPSILAMLSAVYVFYLAARELFERDLAFIAAVIFCLQPIIVFAAIDIRPYAFGALATTVSILLLFRLRRSNSIWLAALFGLSAACVIWFQYLFIAILPAFLLCFFIIKSRDRKTLWRQFGAALAGFTVTFLPLIPGFIGLFQTRRTHGGVPAPHFPDLLWTLAPGWFCLALCATICIAYLVFAATRQRYFAGAFETRHLVLCASLGFIPILILYGVSVGTSVHAFLPRHCLDGIPGVVLFWTFILSRFCSRSLRLFFCVTLVTLVSAIQFSSAQTRKHDTTWKYALEVAEKNASADNAPVLICSGFIEADYETMPADSAKDDRLYSPLAYYKLSVPVVPLPMSLNDEAKRVGSAFLPAAARKHERFLAFAQLNSQETLDWLSQNSSSSHSVRELGTFDGVKVLEFLPLAKSGVLKQ